MKNAAAYIRVSTEDQTEYSPEAQLKAIKNYCKQHELILLPEHIFADEGKSGRKAEKRPAFMKMIGVAKTKPTPFDVILVHKFDRFARNREDSVVYKSLLDKECGIKVISITETIENDKISLIMESMLEAMAEYYSINLSEEVKKGMTEKAYRGEPLSIAPFGYKMENKQLIIDEEEAGIVRYIYNEFLNGTGYLTIAKAVSNMGVRTHRGNKFENRTVEYILRNPVYKGYIRWNPTERTRRKYDHKDIIISKGTHEPIISEEMFEKVQFRVAEIKKMYRPYYKPQYKKSSWIVGLVSCPTCGSSMVNNGGYFVCNYSVRGLCSTRNSIKKERLETLIIEKIEEDISNFKNINYSISSLTEKKAVQELDDIEDKLKIAYTKLSRIKEAYQSGIDTLEEYKTNKQLIQNEIDKLKVNHNTGKEDLKDKYKSLVKDKIKSLHSTLLSDMSDSEKNVASREIIKNIIYNKSTETLDIFYQLTIV